MKSLVPTSLLPNPDTQQKPDAPHILDDALSVSSGCPLRSAGSCASTVLCR
jgi:hypothetical protein